MKKGLQFNKNLGRLLSLVLTLALIVSGVPAKNTQAAALSNIKGKTFFFLGSSVTYGYAAGGVSFADYIAQRNDCTSVKEAVSGTTLVDNGSSSYVQRMLKNFNRSQHCDHFICQLSTNDASQNKPLGSLSSSYNLSDFDTSTIYGAIEYIVCFAKQTWNCPVTFYTNPYYNNGNYQNMVNAIYAVKDKWGIGLIDMWNNQEMRNISAADRQRYMADDIHPTAAGYLEWWTPIFENYLQNYNYSSSPIEVIGLQASSPSNGTINVVWGQTQSQIDNGQKYNVYVNNTKKLSAVACGSYDITGLSSGTYNVKVTATLNGQETSGATTSVTVAGGSENPTTANSDGFVQAGQNWTDLNNWSVYFASGWANDPTGKYKDGGSYNDFAVLIDKASGVDWGIQLKTKELSVESQKSYTCKVKVTSNMAVSQQMRLKDDISQTDTLFTLASGSNEITLNFTSADKAQIFFDLGQAPQNLKFEIKGFELINNDAQTQPPETTTEEPTTRIFDAFDIIEAEYFAEHQNGVVDNNSNASGGHNVGGVIDQTVLQYDNVVFSEAAGGMEICYSSPKSIANGNAEIYVDNMNNKVASINLPNNSTAWETYGTHIAQFDTNISAGVHTIFIKFVTTSTERYVANVDWFRIMKATDFIDIIYSGIDILGYQVSHISKGMRTVYCVDSTINGQAVVESGLIYSLTDYANENELYVGSPNSNVKNFASTSNGIVDIPNAPAAATSYAMTMLFATNTAAERTAEWRIRAYAKLADGSYVYTNCKTYRIFDIAQKLYERNIMPNEASHNFLYTDILKIVDANYVEKTFKYKNMLVR
ncbi:MAG: carbohydrate-binding protein [Lachnospiraceae bacterium]|nr:carbohydrate-binding protein [Lachnospiraceae bacterium]